MHSFSKIGALALAATALSTGAVAATGSTGTVTLGGHVDAKCSVVGGSGSTFSSSVDLGDLSGSDGQLRAALAATTASSPAGGVQNFQIACTGAGNTITLKADPIKAQTAAATGYANTINYTAEVDVALASGSTSSTSHASDSTVTTTNLNAADRLANLANNVQIKAYGLNTTAGALLVADPNYSGLISVTISPGA
ncbi:hypothetical protein ACO2Q3_19350 [Caulobacter sp. KR2-114]|uniref:hypothetical protein n=1 Tax=Caulobacter sp. KR2-114 TaxID=3400912 RepID=UPI003BFCF79F